MRFAKTKALAAAGSWPCRSPPAADDDDSGGDSTEVDVAEDADFPDGQHDGRRWPTPGKITIGVKIDQPGIGFQEPGADAPEGFDIEMGKIIAAGLGIAPEDIEWKETISDNREPFIKSGEVDIVPRRTRSPTTDAKRSVRPARTT